MYFIIILLIILLICLLYSKTEGFDPLLTVDSPNLIDVNYYENAPRNVRFNRGGGIMYVTNQQMPLNCNQIKCPDYIDESITLGKNNYCWQC